MLTPRTVLSAAVTVALAGVLLTGCSGSAGSAQSQKDACASLEKDLASASADLSSAFSNVQTDPSGAEKSLAKFDDALKTASGKVTNAKVKTATAATVTSVDKMDAALKVYIADKSKTSDLETSAASVQKTFTKLGSLCTA